MPGSSVTVDAGPRFPLSEAPPDGGSRSGIPGVWRVAGGSMDLREPVVMGILNMTPDSFSDGGELSGVADGLKRARSMVQAGAGLLDVGGESTRPGARPVPADEEIRRVVPLIRAASRELGVPVSVDTRKAVVARAALDAGASVVNDVSGLRHDPALGELVARRGAGLVLMHMRGDPATMGERAVYEDVVGEIVRELGASLDLALDAGVRPESVVVDPGIGFAKTAEHNLTVLRELDRLQALGRPVMVGPSRKSFLGHLLGVPVEERLSGTVASCVLAYLEGARVFRVHDVAPVVQALAVARAVASPGQGPRVAART